MSDVKVSVAVAAALNPFSTNNPRAWFKLAQSRFLCCQITTDEEKCGRVLEALPPEVFERIAPWLETQPDEGMKYTDLKDELLSCYTSSSTSRAQQILDLVNNPASTHSERWRQIDALQHNTDGSTLDLAWELWLTSLPAAVRLQVRKAPSAKLSDKSAVVREADTIQKQLDKEMAKEPSGHAMAAQPKKYQQNRQAQQNRFDDTKDKIIDGYCWYHRTHKHRARKCLEGCKKFVDLPAKNGTGGQ